MHLSHLEEAVMLLLSEPFAGTADVLCGVTGRKPGSGQTSSSREPELLHPTLLVTVFIGMKSSLVKLLSAEKAI